MNGSIALSIACCLIAAVPTLVRAQSDGYTLEQAVAVMRRGHPQLAAARAAIAAAQGDAIDAGLWQNPSLSGGWTRGLRRNSYDQSGYVDWGLSQLIEVSNVPGARRKAAELGLLASRSDLAAAYAGLELDLEDAMIARSSDAENARILQAILTGLHDIQRVIQDRVQAGAAPPYDAARIAITVATLEADLADAQADQSQDDAQLRAAIGPGVESLHGEPRYDLYGAPDLPPVAALEKRLHARPDVVALRVRARSADAAIAASSGDVFRGVQLEVNGGFGVQPGQVDLGVGISLPLPIIDHGQGSIPAARARATEARQNAFAVQTPAELSLAGTHQSLLQRRAALDAFRRVLASSSEQMLSEARAGYLAAKFSVLELADAYLALRDARLREVQLAHDARSSEVDLGRLIGGPLRNLPALPRGAP